MSAQAVEGRAGLVPARPGATASGRKAAPRRADWGPCCSLASGALGLALLGACTGDPSPGPLMVGGGFDAAFTERGRDEPQAYFRLAPTLASVVLAPAALQPPPLPVLRPRLAVVLPPPPAPRKPFMQQRIAWIPQPKPERRPAPAPLAEPRHAIWPPPWKPEPAELPLAVVLAATEPPEDPPHPIWPSPWKPDDLPRPVTLAAGTSEDPRHAIWPPPWKPDELPLAVAPAAGPPEEPGHAIWPPPQKPDDLPRAVALAAGPPEDPRRPEGLVPIVVAHGRDGGPATDDGIAVSEIDELLPQLDRAAREALLAGDPATALAIYERLATRFPEERTVWLGRAVALERLGRGSEAQALYQARLGTDPEDLDAKIALLGIVADLAPDEALRLLRRLAQHHPDDARLHAQIALVLGRQGALPAAIAEQRRAVALAPGNLGYRINLAILHDRAGGIDAAIEHYRSALELATLGGVPTAQLDAIAARLHHLRARQRPAAASPTR